MLLPPPRIAHFNVLTQLFSCKRMIYIDLFFSFDARMLKIIRAFGYFSAHLALFRGFLARNSAHSRAF
ncbi:MAG: hypothetical protein CVV06_18320 [Gammaproteobacteria bacterium HGW-Gammaproteobacteria-10]|nr:MAG: hypothetical protein CVV06_18320 [Gammaproteobacteria bacterium HGW-Gammaproteobacteria-10]